MIWSTRTLGIERTGGNAGTNSDPALFEADRRASMDLLSPSGNWRDPRKDQQQRTVVGKTRGGCHKTNGMIMRNWQKGGEA